MASLTVSVACKLPQGLTVTHKGLSVTLAGANASGNRFGFGITPGVDADWFNDWATTDARELPAIKRGMIFAMESAAKAKDAARERRGDKSVQTGAEPIDPNAPGANVEATDASKEELAKAAPTDVR